jgi:hypothetical protein
LGRGGVVRIQQSVNVDALEIGAVLEEQLEQIPASRFQREVECGVTLELEPEASLQEKKSKRVLPGLKGDLERGLDSRARGGLDSRARGNGGRRDLKCAC